MNAKDNSKHNQIVSLTNDFYICIPHNFGIKKPPILDHVIRIKEKTRMLEILEDIVCCNQILLTNMDIDFQRKNPYDAIYDTLGINLTSLD